MIIEEFLDEGTSVHHFSTEKVKILQVETGIVYDDAIDVVPCPFTYEETKIPLEDPTDEEEDLALAAKILLGVAE